MGDVKQSIYRFRLADPTIFLGKYRAFADYTRAAEGEERRLILSRNFRSRPEVLEGANFVFRSVMSADFGEMDYTADEALYPGAPFPPDGRYAVELDAVDASAEGRRRKTARDLIEARFTAKRIRRWWTGASPVSDGEGGERPVRPADIVILLRSPNTVLHHYARALGERGIPGRRRAAATSRRHRGERGPLPAPDRGQPKAGRAPHLRPPLPVYGFSADRLAEPGPPVPTPTSTPPWPPTGGEDSRAFLAELDELRFGAGELSSHELLWQLYDRTNLLGCSAQWTGGGAAVHLLTPWRSWPAASRGRPQGPVRLFVLPDPAAGERGQAGLRPRPGGGGVRILSIHKSKGLESPWCFSRAGAKAQPGGHELTHPVPPCWGWAPSGWTWSGDGVSPWPRRAVARKLELEMMAEELRLLYGHDPGQGEADFVGGPHRRGADLEKLAPRRGLSGGAQVLAGVPERGAVGAAPALARPDGRSSAGPRGCRCPSRRRTSVRPGISALWTGRSSRRSRRKRHFPIRSPDGEMISAGAGEETTALAARLAWHYPPRGGGGAALQAHRHPAQGAGAGRGRWPRRRSGPRPIRLGRPRFAAEEFGLTPAQKGTALHLVMQYIDFERTGARGAGAGRDRPAGGAGLPHPPAGEAVDPAKIAAFFASPPGAGADGLHLPAEGVQVLHPGSGGGLLPPGQGRRSRCSSRAWWTAALRLWRASPWWTSRPTGWTGAL